MQEGIQLPELLARIKVLREAGLRAEHVAFSFMKQMVQPLMARDTLGFEYTGNDDTSRMPGGEVDDDDIVERLTWIFKDMPPPHGIEILKEGKAKAKERREVGEGDDTVIVEDASDDDDDEETLQDHFQLRSRFSRPGLPHVPLVQDPPTSLEASLAVPPRKPRNPARKRVTKKLKVTETTPQEVRSLDLCSRVPVERVHLLISSLPWMQEVPPMEPVEEGVEGEWDTVGEPAGSRSPAPTVEELLAQLER
jgi:hypothetical protein